MIVGYDPVRVAALAHLCGLALGDVTAIASTDSAAAEAMEALGRLRRSIETGVLATAENIVRTAPLTRSFAPRDAGERARRTAADRPAWRPSDSDRVGGGWLSEHVTRLIVGAFARLTDEQLLVVTRNLLTDATDRGRLFDVRSPAWQAQRVALRREIERRTVADSGFADTLLWYVDDDPLLALVVVESGLPEQIRLDALARTVLAGSGSHQRDHLRGDTIASMMPTVLGDPALALALIGHPGVVAAMIDWDAADNVWVDLGTDDAVDLVGAAFSSPSSYDLGTRDEPANGDAMARALKALIVLMNSEHGDRGLPGDLGAAYAAGLVPLLPRIIHGFDGDEVFRLHRDDSTPVPVELGATSESMLDLLGGLSRHPEARSSLLAAIPILGASVGPRFTATQLAGFVVAFGRSVRNEQLEESIRETRREHRWTSAVSLLAQGTRGAAALTAPTSGSVDLAIDLAVGVSNRLIDQFVDADDLDLTQVPRVIESLLTLGLVARLVADHRDDDRFDSLNEQFEWIDAGLADARSDEREEFDLVGEVDLLGDRLRRLVGHAELTPGARRDVDAVVAALDDPGFHAAPFRTADDVDLAE